MIVHKVKLKASNSSGDQTLWIIPSHPDCNGETALTLTGEYEGEEIQIDFDPVKNEDFAKTLKFLLSQVEACQFTTAKGGYYRTTDDGIPVWVDGDGFTHPYTHQDEDYSNLCESEYCRCKS